MEDILRIKRSVVVAHTGVVASDDEMAAAVVLTEDGMEQSFTGTGVTHFHGITALNDRVFNKIIFHEDINAADTDFGGDIAGLEFAEQLMDVEPVADFEGDLRQVFMRPVHGVAQLQSGDGFPALFLKEAAAVSGAMVDIAEFMRIVALTDHFHRTAQVPAALLQDFLYTGMFGVSGFEDLPAFMLFVDLVFFPNFHRAHEGIGFAVVEGDVVTFIETCGGAVVDGQGDGDGPEDAVIEAHFIADTFPVLFAHETIQRSEGADAHHDQVRSFTAGHHDFGKGFGTLDFACPHILGQQEWI